jgi:uncharacterized protein YlzI (FlbEa/FlbD family)
MGRRKSLKKKKNIDKRSLQRTFKKMRGGVGEVWVAFREKDGMKVSQALSHQEIAYKALMTTSYNIMSLDAKIIKTTHDIMSLDAKIIKTRHDPPFIFKIRRMNLMDPENSVISFLNYDKTNTFLKILTREGSYNIRILSTEKEEIELFADIINFIEKNVFPEDKKRLNALQQVLQKHNLSYNNDEAQKIVQRLKKGTIALTRIKNVILKQQEVVNKIAEYEEAVICGSTEQNIFEKSQLMGEAVTELKNIVDENTLEA